MSRRTTAEHSVEITRPIDEVFSYVADARNDPQRCPRVISCEQTEGNEPGPMVRYRAVHNPTFLRKKTRDIQVVKFEEPRMLRWRQEDANGVFHIEYRLEPIPTGVRFTQRDVIDWKLPALAVEVGRRIVPRHIRQQFKHLKRTLEARASPREAPSPP